MPQCLLMLTITCLNVYKCLILHASMFTHVYYYLAQCLPMSTITYSITQCVPMFTITCLNVHQCSPLHTQYLPMFTNFHDYMLQCIICITVVNITCQPLHAPKHRSIFCHVQESGIVANNRHHPGAIYSLKIDGFLYMQMNGNQYHSQITLTPDRLTDFVQTKKI